MRVSEVMTREVDCTKSTETLREAAQRMRLLNVGALPVCDDDRLVGMVTDRDITIRSTADGTAPTDIRVGDVMTRKVIYCFEDALVKDAALLMEEKQIRRLVVLDSNKRLVGIVSLGDLAVVTHNSELAGSALEGISVPNRPANATTRIPTPM